MITTLTGASTMDQNLPSAVQAALAAWDGETKELNVPEHDFPFGTYYLILGDMEFDPFVITWCGEDEIDIITMGNTYIKLDSGLLRQIADWADGIDLAYEDWKESAEGLAWLGETE